MLRPSVRRFGALALAISGMAAACSPVGVAAPKAGSTAPPSPSSSPTGPQQLTSGTLPSGTYATTLFEPGLTFTLADSPALRSARAG